MCILVTILYFLVKNKYCSDRGANYRIKHKSVFCRDETSLQVLVWVLAMWSPAHIRAPARHIVPSERSQKDALKIIKPHKITNTLPSITARFRVPGRPVSSLVFCQECLSHLSQPNGIDVGLLQESEKTHFLWSLSF